MRPAPGAPTHLRVEHREAGALGLLVPEPRLSWRLPDGARGQVAHRLTADVLAVGALPAGTLPTGPAPTGTPTSAGVDTGWVRSDQHLLVAWPGPPLASSQRVTWRVQVETDLGRTTASAPHAFETGLLDARDWRASWIGPGRDPGGPAGRRPAALLRCRFDVGRPVVAARLHATARGIHETFVNGHRADDAELTPGSTQYDARLQVRTTDVTALVRGGANTLAVVLADGWFRGQVGITRAGDQWGDRTSLLAQLHLAHDDGSTTVVGTGPGWRSTTGHVVAADLVAGEHVDLRLLHGPLRGWDTPAFDDAGWDRVLVVPPPAAALVDSPAPPVRRVAELVPVSVTRLESARQVVDLGQAVNGWVRLGDLGPAGTTTTLTHGEWLGPDGDVTVEHLRPAVPFLPHPLDAGQVDVVVSAGVPGEAFEPRRTTHGFRYVRVEGHPRDLTVDDVRGVVVHTDLRRTGWFSCSDQRLDALHEAAVWSLRSNACDIPTDCPHRERAGWTGDWQLFAPTAAFLYDVAGFSTKWLRDVAADAWPDGTVAGISPTARSEGRDSPIAALHGSAGWGDAAVLVPWELYRAYGDAGVLAELWPTMVAWLGRAERMAAGARHPARAARRPQPAPHERYLWDTGFHWGEWMVPGEEVGDFAAFVAADEGPVATAYFARSAEVAGAVAAVLGRDADAIRYRTLAGHVRAAWAAEYTGDDGRLRCDTQADHVRALAFGLVPQDRRAAVADRLVELVRAAGTHLGTGFLATPLLLPVLAEAGHLDVAYELLLADTEPSWLTMIDRGATTLWERWDGVDADGVPHDSLNHCSKGAVVSFLHRVVAGIELLDDGPAYRRFRIRPQPGGGLTWAQAAHESPHGRIESSWRTDAGRFRLRVVVPAGTQAEVVLPSGATHAVGPGEHAFG